MTESGLEIVARLRAMLKAATVVGCSGEESVSPAALRAVRAEAAKGLAAAQTVEEAKAYSIVVEAINEAIEREPWGPEILRLEADHKMWSDAAALLNTAIAVEAEAKAARRAARRETWARMWAGCRRIIGR